MVNRLHAPALPAEHGYRISIAHDNGPAEVTVRIVQNVDGRGEFVERSRYTERTRVSLDMAVVAAARGAYEGLNLD